MNRALLVGINKYPDSPLQGCVNDISDMAKYLTERGFKKSEIRLLTDRRATKKAILERLHWLLDAAKPGNHVVFHYSGHGAQVPTRNKAGEVDGLDECICPVDFDWEDEHLIRDKEFHALFHAIPVGVNFIWISDSCHSGDLTKGLPQQDQPHCHPKTMLPPADIDWRLQTALEAGMTPGKLSGSLTGSPLNLAFISGCKSNQTSADANFQGRYNGALTYALLHVLRENSTNPTNTSLVKIVQGVNEFLIQSHFSQRPQLEGAATLKGQSFFW